LAHKILEDQEHPTAGDRTISVTDPEARRGKHSDWYQGDLVDVSIDPDSEPQERSRVYRFSAATCRTCPLMVQCMKQAPRRRGRTVRKSEYQAEHDRVGQKATTPAYARRIERRQN
jgi:hypothetical protein